ncbi:Ig-like domain-containing protein [Clostridium sp. K25]|uniref:Ig-like domain-containing protein n=1 Tax=Clostridium sp. K25 TaxID=1443109 RepID=UPI00069EF282|nr:Ig-like domain-containing protein [Clostridium sp. K25]
MSNNKTLKVFSSTAVAGMIAAAMMSSQAFAAVDAYSVKVGDQIYKYDRVELEKSFLDSKAGDKAALYEDFTKKLGEAKGFYAFNDTKNGYVDYNSIEAKFLEAKDAGQKFDVNAFTESKDAKIVEVKAVKKAIVNKDGKVEYIEEKSDDSGEGVKIKSITPLTLKQVKIEFAQKVEDTDKKNDIEDIDNYTLKDNDNDEVDDVIKEVKLDESKKFAILTFKDKVDPDNANNFIIQNREKYTLIVDEDVTGDEVKEKLKFSDTDLPTVQGLEVVGKDTIKVKFSEPIKPWNLEEISKGYDKDEKNNNIAAILDKDDFEVKDVKGGDLSISKVELVNDGKEANIIVGTDFDDKQEISVKVKATVKDYAGLAVISDSKNVTVKKDTAIPEVIGAKNVESDEVTLIFNKDIKFKDIDQNIIDEKNNSGDLDKFYHTNDSNKPYKVKIDGRELTMYFDDDCALPPDSAIMYIKSDVLESRWEVKNEKITYKVTRDNDTIKPEVTKVTQDKDYNNKIRVKFSEKVKCKDSKSDNSALKTGNYTIKDSKGKEWKISDIKQDGSSEKEFILTTTKDLDSDLKYKLTVENIEDKAGNAIKKVTKEFKVTDNDPVKQDDVKVTVYSSGTSDQKIVVDFDSKMKTDDSKYSIKDLSKYTLVSDKKDAFDGKQSITLDKLYKATIKSVKDDNAVEISVPCSHDAGKRKDKEFDLSEVGTLTMQVSRVADKAGNVTERNFEISGDQFVTREKYNPTIDFDTDEDYRPQIISPEEIFFGFDDKVDFDIKDIKVVAATSKEAANAVANGKAIKDGEKAELLDIANNKTKSHDGNTTVRLTINKSLRDKGYDDDDYNHIFTYDGKRIVDGEKLDVYVVVVPSKKGNTATKNKYDETLKIQAVKVEDKLAPTIVDNEDRAKSNKYLGNDKFGVSDNDDEAVEYIYNEKDNTGKLVLTFEEEIDNASVSTSSVTLNKDDFKDAKVKSVVAKGNKVTIELYNLVDETKDNKKVKIEEGHEILLHGIKDMNHNEGKELKLQVGGFAELKEKVKPAPVVVKKDELNKSIEAANKLVKDAAKYTKESVEKVQAALDKAKTAKTQEEVDAAKAEIDAAVKAIKPVEVIKENELLGKIDSKFSVSYVNVDIKNIDTTKLIKVILDGKELAKDEDFGIESNELRIMQGNKDSKIQVIVGDKTYNVVVK